MACRKSQYLICGPQCFGETCACPHKRLRVVKLLAGLLVFRLQKSQDFTICRESDMSFACLRSGTRCKPASVCSLRLFSADIIARHDRIIGFKSTLDYEMYSSNDFANIISILFCSLQSHVFVEIWVGKSNMFSKMCHIWNSCQL